MSEEERRTQRVIALNSALSSLESAQRDVVWLLVDHPRARRLTDAAAHVMRAQRLLRAYSDQITR